jgi:hypothetical protein
MSHHWTELWRFLNPFHPILTFLAGTGAVVVRKYRQKKRENRAAMWPSAEAVVQVAALKPRSGGWLLGRSQLSLLRHAGIPLWQV